MVGSQTGSSTCLTQFPDTDNDHEGHSGSLASDYAANGNLTRWLDAQPTVDVVIMFLGHNDILFGKRSQETILKAYDTLLAQMRSKNPKMQIVWSNLTPVSPEKFDDAKAAGIKALSAKIKEIAPGKSTKDSPVRFVNNYEGYVASSDTEDGLHPNNVGNEKMASKFVGATRDAILAVSQSQARVNERRVTMKDRRVRPARSGPRETSLRAW
jgi:lysophospholipase L1-like esterase